MFGNGVASVVLAIAAVVTALGVIGAAIALVGGSFRKAQADALRQDNVDLRSRQEDQEKEIQRLKANDVQNKQRITHLEKDNGRLEELVLQRAKVDEVFKAVNDHNRKAEEAWARAEVHSQAVEDLTLRMVQAVEHLGEQHE